MRRWGQATSYRPALRLRPPRWEFHLLDAVLADHAAKATPQGSRATGVTLPDGDHPIVPFAKRPCDSFITCPVGLELLQPELAIPLGNRRPRTTRVGVPETSVYAHYPTARPVGDVRTSWKVTVRDSKPESQPVEYSTHGELGRGMLLSDSGEARRCFRIGAKSRRISRTLPATTHGGNT